MVADTDARRFLGRGTRLDVCPRGQRHVAGQRILTLALLAVLLAAATSASRSATQTAAETTPAAPGAPPDEAVQTFAVLHYVVEGNSVLSAEVVEAAIYRHMGKGKGIDDVEAARRALEQAYVNAGYQTVLVDIPEQDVSSGRVRLRVTEGRIDRVRVTGSRYFSLRRIREEVPALTEGLVPHVPSLEKELAKASGASADRRLTPTLRAGRTPGTLEAEIEVEDTLPLHANLEVNTRNAVGTTLFRTIGSLRYDNLFQRFHSASLQAQVSPQALNEIQVLSGTYVIPAGDWRLVGYAVQIESESPITGVGALAVVGSGRLLGLRALRPFAQSADSSHTLTLGVDYKSFDQSIVLVGADDLRSPITYAPFLVRYDGSWRGPSDDLLRLALEANFSIRGLGNEQSEFEDRRFLARANYAFLQAEAELRRTLPLSGQLRLRLQGQITDSPLISNEQFSLGGADSVRGYFETEALGDDGLFASAEVSQQLPWPRAWTLLPAPRGLVFIDAGQTWIRSALPETPEQIALAGAGLGIRMDVPRAARLAFDWGWRLLEPPGLRQDPSRIHLTVSRDF